MPAPYQAANAMVILEAAEALLEAGRPEEALNTIRNLADMEITPRQREQYNVLRQEIEAQLVSDSWVTLQLAHPEPLTFQMLTEAIMPYLAALHRLHEVAAQLQGKPPAIDPEIRQMSHHSPFSITLGYWHPEIIQMILDMIFEERRRPMRSRKAGKIPEQPWLTRVDAAYTLLEQIIPKANERQKIALAGTILPEVDILASSPIEAQVIGVSVAPATKPPVDFGASPHIKQKPGTKPAEPPEPEQASAAAGSVEDAEDVENEAENGDEDEPDSPPLTQAAEPRYSDPPRRYYPRRRVTRPAPKPYSSPKEDDETEDKDG